MKNYILPLSSLAAFTHNVAYFKIKFIEYWIKNCLIPPNKEASELFKGIMEIKKSIFSFTLRCELRQDE